MSQTAQRRHWRSFSSGSTATTRETNRYQRSDHDRISAARTVIVDECSMLTEEALDALFDGIEGYRPADPRRRSTAAAADRRRAAIRRHRSAPQRAVRSGSGSLAWVRLCRTHHPSAAGRQCGRQRPGRPPAGGVVRRRRAEPGSGRSVGQAERGRGPRDDLRTALEDFQRAGWAASQRARQRCTSDVGRRRR